MFRLISRSLLYLAVCVALTSPKEAQAYARQDGEFDFGFLADRKVLDDGTVRTRILGPLWEHRSGENADDPAFMALRPLYSFDSDPEVDRTVYDLLWPLATRHDIDQNTSARMLLTYYRNADRDDKSSAWRFWLLPIYFQGMNELGEKYLAVFPLGGSIKGILMRDEVSFILFPLRWTSSLNDLESDGWLWPIFSRATAEGLERFRIFPFYGRAELRDDYVKKFVMWPFYTEARYGHDGEDGKAWILFPLTGHVKTAEQEGWWLLPPFFRFHQGERQDKYLFPWPFIQIEKGEVDKFYIWPLWGTRTAGNYTKTFALWPFITHRHQDTPGMIEDRWTAWPLWYSDTVNNKATPEVDYTYRKLWPLFSYKATPDQRRFRMLDLLPMRDREAVDRNWSPWWTLFESKRSGAEYETELLWGLFRKHRIENEYRYWSIFPFFDRKTDLEKKDSSWNFLKGLIGRSKDEAATQWKLLYFFRWESENP